MTTRHPPQVPTDPLDLTTERSAAHVDRMLDEAIEDSFPSSDPVSLAMPHDRIESPDAAASGRRTAYRRDASWPLLLVGGIVLALLLRRHH